LRIAVEATVLAREAIGVRAWVSTDPSFIRNLVTVTRKTGTFRLPPTLLMALLGEIIRCGEHRSANNEICVKIG
jgi:hypothetical protein